MLLMSAFLFALWLSLAADAPPDDDPDDDDPDDDDGGSGLPAGSPMLPRPWPPRVRLFLPRSLPQPVPARNQGAGGRGQATAEEDLSPVACRLSPAL